MRRLDRWKKTLLLALAVASCTGLKTKSTMKYKRGNNDKTLISKSLNTKTPKKRQKTFCDMI